MVVLIELVLMFVVVVVGIVGERDFVDFEVRFGVVVRFC